MQSPAGRHPGLSDHFAVMQRDHFRLRLEGSVPGLPVLIARRAVEASDKSCADTLRVSLRRQLGIGERAVEHTLAPGPVQRGKQFGGPARSSAAGIVPGIGKDHRHIRFLRQRNRFLDRGQIAHEELAHRPGRFGQLGGQRIGGSLILACGDDHRQRILRHVREDEVAEDRDVEDRPAHLRLPPLALIDECTVGRLGGKQRHRGGRDGRLDQRCPWPLARREDSPQRERRFLAPLTHVDMGVRAVTDDQVAFAHHRLGYVGVQIERHDDRHVRPDGLAHPRDERAVGIVQMRGDHRAVIADIDRIERSGFAQQPLVARGDLLEHALLHRSGGMARGQQAGNGLPRPGCIHRMHEGGELGGQHRRGRAGLFH